MRRSPLNYDKGMVNGAIDWQRLEFGIPPQAASEKANNAPVGGKIVGSYLLFVSDISSKIYLTTELVRA